jgi:large subunit ribosomal protein L17
MRHKVKKIKIKLGTDSNKMLLRKLLKNFLREGKITSTLKRIKLLKTLVEKIISQAKIDNEKNRAYLYKYLNDKKLVNFVFNNVVKVFSDLNGGYVKLIKLKERNSDGALLAELTWLRPIVKNVPETKQLKIKTENKAK